MFFLKKGMENDKSPGPDGLTNEFYFKFIDIFGPMLLQLYDNIFNENSLSESQKMSYITLIIMIMLKIIDQLV